MERAVELATANPYWNPRPFDRDDIGALIQQAYNGARPSN